VRKSGEGEGGEGGGGEEEIKGWVGGG